MRSSNFLHGLQLGAKSFVQTPFDLVKSFEGGTLINAEIFPNRKIAAEAKQYQHRLGLAVHSALAIGFFDSSPLAAALNVVPIATILICTKGRRKRLMKLFGLEKIKTARESL